MKAGAYAEPSGSASPAASNGVKAGVARWLVGLPLPVMGLALIIETISADIDAALVLLGAIALQLAGIGLVRRGLKTRQSGGVEAALNSPSPVLGLGLAALVAALFLTCLAGQLCTPPAASLCLGPAADEQKGTTLRPSLPVVRPT